MNNKVKKIAKDIRKVNDWVLAAVIGCVDSVGKVGKQIATSTKEAHQILTEDEKSSSETKVEENKN